MEVETGWSQEASILSHIGGAAAEYKFQKLKMGEGYGLEGSAYHFELLSRVFLFGRNQDCCKDRSYIKFN